jgi:hypothetical protein
MIFMPPRHGKSELASRRFPAYFIGRNPDRSIIGRTMHEVIGSPSSVDGEASARISGGRRPGPNLDHLIIAGEFKEARGHPRIPDGKQLVNSDAWRAACIKKRLCNGTKASEERVFRRVEKELSDRNLIGTYDSYVWPIVGHHRTTFAG